MLSQECQTLVKRLKECNIDEIQRNPSQMLKYYPIRDPDNETTVFDEVYPIISADLLRKSYRFKTLYFVNTLLSSMKVPAYVIASYIKKLSRLSLNAKPRILLAILKLVGNLFIRHPTLWIMRDRVDDKARELEATQDRVTIGRWLEIDPFDDCETKDLRATNAIDSFIWELLPLRYHPHPRISKAAAYLSVEELPDMEFDMNSVLR